VSKTKKIAIVGHVDHGKTSVTASLLSIMDETKRVYATLSEDVEDVIEEEEKGMNINQILEEQKSYKLQRLHSDIDYPIKSGQEMRRERRKKKRKNKL
jgi:translation elongation factor EF-Tu-like GTPase